MVTKIKRPAVKGAGKSRVGGNRPGTAATRQAVPGAPVTPGKAKPALANLQAPTAFGAGPTPHPSQAATGKQISEENAAHLQAGEVPVPGKDGSITWVPNAQAPKQYQTQSGPGEDVAKHQGWGLATGPQKFDLNSALAQYLAPYIQDSQQAATQAGQQGIGAYLQGTNLPAGIAQSLQQGNQAEDKALAGMGPALQSEANQSGSAGLLADLLNAAKYQAIYKQSLYGAAPPANTTEGQLYQQVTAGGGALTGTPFTGSATTPTTVTQTANAPLSTGG
jgi:hypothetical protein